MVIDMQDPTFNLVQSCAFPGEVAIHLEDSEYEVGEVYEIFQQTMDVEESFEVFKRDHLGHKKGWEQEAVFDRTIFLKVIYTSTETTLIRKSFNKVVERLFKGNYLIELSGKIHYFMLYWKQEEYSYCFNPITSGLYIFDAGPSEEFYRLVSGSAKHSES